MMLNKALSLLLHARIYRMLDYLLLPGCQPGAAVRTIHIVMSDSDKPLQFMVYTKDDTQMGGERPKGNDQISRFNCDIFYSQNDIIEFLFVSLLLYNKNKCAKAVTVH